MSISPQRSPPKMISEKVLRPVPGLPMALFLIAAGLFGGWLFYTGARSETGGTVALAVGLFLLVTFLAPGLMLNQPNEAKVLTLFGRYTGSVKESGFWWVNPLDRKSTRLNSSHLVISYAVFCLKKKN